MGCNTSCCRIQKSRFVHSQVIRSTSSVDSDNNHRDRHSRRSSGPGNVFRNLHSRRHNATLQRDILENFDDITAFASLDTLVGEIHRDVGDVKLNSDFAVKIHFVQELAKTEKGWLGVLSSLMNLPPEAPLSIATMGLLLNECPLISREQTIFLHKALDINEEGVTNSTNFGRKRNAVIIIGLLAEMMAGASSTRILTVPILAHLLKCVYSNETTWEIRLHALVALEKFARTTENKAQIRSYLVDLSWPSLEEYLKILCEAEEDVCGDLACHQVAFCASWLLDNLFVPDDHIFLYEVNPNDHLNALLNNQDTSEYLKLSADGLEARCDSDSFESVRCTFAVTTGTWYYEVTLITAGVMQIGWAARDSKFLNHEGYGIGDDSKSVAYDGCRQLWWFEAEGQLYLDSIWKPGDVVGCAIQMEESRIRFYLNGRELATIEVPDFWSSTHSSDIFAAASFMSFQQCRFNFGATPFKYPPKLANVSSFQDHGVLTEAERRIIPKLMRSKQLAALNEEIMDSYCVLCCDSAPNTMLEPCGHGDLCFDCAQRLETCPFCKLEIERRVSLRNL